MSQDIYAVDQERGIGESAGVAMRILNQGYGIMIACFSFFDYFMLDTIC